MIGKENGNVPLDEQVIDKICLERLAEDLTAPEMDVVNYKVMDELYDDEIRENLRIGRRKLKEIKEGLRYKIKQAFAD